MTESPDPQLPRSQPASPPPAQEAYPPPAQEPYPAPAPAAAWQPYGAPSTAAMPAGMYLDQVSGLTLPEGTQLASVGRRIGAYFLAIPLSIVTLGIGYIIWGLIVWARGQTPALQVLGMRCWRPADNQVPGWGWMAVREVIGTLVEGILSIITELVSFILMLSTRERRCLHDMIAGTVVLYDPDKVLDRRP